MIIMESKNDFLKLVEKYGAALSYDTLGKLLDSKLSTFPQYWIFVIGVLFTMVNYIINLELTIKNEALLIVSSILILIVSFALPFLFFYYFTF